MKKKSQTLSFWFLSKFIYFLLTPFGLLIMWFYLRTTVNGRGNIPKKDRGGFLIVSNHALYLDPLIIAYAIFPRSVSHSTILRNMQLPVVGRFIALMGAFAIHGHGGWQTMSESIAAQVQQGRIVHFFPEGELKHFNQTLQRFRNGAFHLSIENNIPVLPVTTVIRRRKLWGRKIHWLPAKIDVYISELCEPTRYKEIFPLYRRATCMANSVKDCMQEVITVRG